MSSSDDDGWIDWLTNIMFPADDEHPNYSAHYYTHDVTKRGRGGGSRKATGKAAATDGRRALDEAWGNDVRVAVRRARDVTAARRLFAPSLRAVLGWKKAGFSIWTAMAALVALVLWCTTLQSIWAVCALALNACLAVLRVSVWVITAGYAGGGDSGSPTPGTSAGATLLAWLSTLCLAALFLLLQVQHAWLKYWLVTVERRVYAPLVSTLRHLVLPPAPLVLTLEALLSAVSVFFIMQLVPGQSPFVTCSDSADGAVRVCIDADAAFVLSVGWMCGVVLTLHVLRSELHVLSFPLLRIGRFHRFRARVAPSILLTLRLTAVCAGVAVLVWLVAEPLATAVVREIVAYFASCDAVLVSDSLNRSGLGGILHFLPRLARAFSLHLLCGIMGRHAVELVLTEAVDFVEVAEGVPGASVAPEVVDGEQRTASSHALMMRGMCSYPSTSVPGAFMRLSPEPLTGVNGHLPPLTPIAAGSADASGTGTVSSTSVRPRPRRRTGLLGWLSRLAWWQPDPNLYSYDDRGVTAAMASQRMMEARTGETMHLGSMAPRYSDPQPSARHLRQRPATHQTRHRGGRRNHVSRWQGQVSRDYRAEDDAGYYHDDVHGVGGLGVADDSDDEYTTRAPRGEALAAWRERYNTVERLLYTGACGVHAPWEATATEVLAAMGTRGGPGGGGPDDDGRAMQRRRIRTRRRRRRGGQRLWRELARVHAFKYGREVARSDPEGRALVFADASGTRWGELLWACTGAVDALSLALQVVSIRGVAPSAAVFKPRRLLRASRRSWLLECRRFDPVLEQSKWLLGKPPAARTGAKSAWAEAQLASRYQQHGRGVSGLDEMTGFVTDSADGLGTTGSAARWGYVGSTGLGGAPSTPGVEPHLDSSTFGGRVMSSMEPNRTRDVLQHGKQTSLDVLRKQKAMEGPQRRRSPAWLRRLLQRSPELVTQALFEDAQVVMDAVDTLAGFAVASLAEDELGIVQNSLPVVVSSLVTCLIALEEYVTSPCFHGAFTTVPGAEGHGVVRPQPTAVKFVLRRALHGMTQAFGSTLVPAMLLAPRIETRLRSFQAIAE